MKTLCLVRHAKSSWKDGGLSDFERPLNDRGRRDAPMMGSLLRARGFIPDYFVTSAANRALTTARLLAKEIAFPETKLEVDLGLYGASAQLMLTLITRFPDSAGTGMLVGHNPGVTDLTNYLSDLNLGNLPTCGMVCIDFSAERWRDAVKGKGEVRFYDSPKNHK